MKYSLALATAALATGAVAGPHRLAHQHKAREAEPYVITYSAGQCFGEGNCVPSWSTPPPETVGGPATEAAPAATKAVSQVAAAPVAQVTHEASHAVAQVKQAVAPSSSSNSGNEDSGSAGGVSGLTGAVGSLISNVESLASRIGVAPLAADSSCKVGSGLNNEMTVSNQAGEDFVWVCWSNGLNQFVNVHSPAIMEVIPQGKSATFSFADTPGGQQGGGCAPMFTNSFLSRAGQINDTMMEFTWNNFGTIDVSKEIRANGGVKMSMQTAQGCTSDMSRCVYQCREDLIASQGYCANYGEYKIENCSGPGVNPSSDATAGGCQAGSNAKVTVTVG